MDLALVEGHQLSDNFCFNLNASFQFSVAEDHSLTGLIFEHEPHLPLPGVKNVADDEVVAVLLQRGGRLVQQDAGVRLQLEGHHEAVLSPQTDEGLQHLWNQRQLHRGGTLTYTIIIRCPDNATMMSVET